MAFKMKGFSPFTQKQQSSKADKLSPEQRAKLGPDVSKWLASSVSVNEFLKNRAKILEELKSSSFKQTEEAAVSGALAGGTAKHPLYGKLTADEKKKYDALSAAEKSNVNKNKELHQLKNALGGPGEEDDK